VNLDHLPAHKFTSRYSVRGVTGTAWCPWRKFAVAAVAPRPAGLRAAVTLDDDEDSDVEIARLLHSVGYNALLFIAIEYVDTKGDVSKSDLLELQRLGMNVGSHAHQHIHLAPLNNAQAEAELTQSTSILDNIMQAAVKHLSFSGSSYPARVLDMAPRTGYRYFYISERGNNARAAPLPRMSQTSVVNTVDLDELDALLRLRN